MTKTRLIWMGLAFVIIGALLFFAIKKRPESEAPVEAPKDLEFYSFDKTVCPGETRKLKMNDVYLRGILEQGSEFNVVINWYACNSPKRGELALYRYSHKALPVVRLIAAIGGDQVKLIKNADLNAWTIAVNGKAVMSEGRPYYIGVADVVPPLGNYLDQNNGVIGKSEVVLLSAFPPGESDSGTLGAINISDLIGRVNLNQDE